MLYTSLTFQIKMTANGQRQQDKGLTNCPNGPVADKLPSTERKVLEREIMQFSFPRLKAIVSKENDGSIIPEIDDESVKRANK